MVNVIVPIENKKLKFDDILRKLANVEEVFIYVGVPEEFADEFKLKTSDADNIRVVTFQNGSKREAIINALQRHIGSGSTMIMRKPITIDEFNRFILNSKDIVTCKRNLSKAKKFMFKIWQRILKFFLGLKQYKGDPSVIYFNEDISAVVATSGNLSFSSRANRWRGIEQGTVKVAGENIKQEVDKKDMIKFSIVSVVALIVALGVTLSVSLCVKVTVIIGLLLICLDLICVAISLVTLVILLFNLSVGKRIVGEATPIIDDSEYEEFEENYQDEEEEEDL